jgi:hypothetical protein
LPAASNLARLGMKVDSALCTRNKKKRDPFRFCAFTGWKSKWFLFDLLFATVHALCKHVLSLHDISAPVFIGVVEMLIFTF